METDILIARINDTAQIAERTSKSKFLGFLSKEQAALANNILKKSQSNFSIYGGHDNANRVMLGCFPEWVTSHDFPITGVTLKYRESENLSHRDFLGTLMGIGLKRETIGDILVENGRAVIFINNDVKNYVLSQIEKVGGTGVHLTPGFVLPLPDADKLMDFSDTVASLRLDCVIAALSSVSRSFATQMILNGYVAVNSVICEKPVKIVSDGDIISIRTKGKFIICDANGRTKKDRIVLKYQKYF